MSVLSDCKTRPNCAKVFCIFYSSRHYLHLYILSHECRHLQAWFSDPHPFHYYFSILADFRNHYDLQTIYQQQSMSSRRDLMMVLIVKLTILYFVHIFRLLADRFSSQSQTMLNSQTHRRPARTVPDPTEIQSRTSPMKKQDQKLTQAITRLNFADNDLS